MPHDHAAPSMHTHTLQQQQPPSDSSLSALHVQLQQVGSPHLSSALVHLQYEDDPTPDYVQRAEADSQGVTHLHLASVAPLSVGRIVPAPGIVVQRAELTSTAAGTAGVRLVWQPASDARATLSASVGLPQPSPSPPQTMLAASHASTNSDAAHRSEIIRSLLFEAQQEREEHSPAAMAGVAAPSLLPHASASLLQPAPLELPDLASLSSMHGSSFLSQQHLPLSLPARALPLPVLDELPSIRALVSDASVLPDTLPSEQPLLPAELSPSPPLAPAAAAAPAASPDSSPEPPPVLLPMPAEWSPPDPATMGTPASPPIAVAAPPLQHKSPTEEKQPEPEDRPKAGARPVPATLFRFQTPPLPSSAPITRAFTASAGASPYRGALNSLFKSSAVPNQLSSLVISRRGSVGRPGSRATHPGSADAISPSRGNAFQVPPASVSMLRQRSQLSSQQAAAAGITPFRTTLTHARSTGSASSLPSSSASNPSSNVASPTGVGMGRFLPASATAASALHPFLDGATSSVRLSDLDTQSHLALVKAQLDEHVEMRMREVRREMEEMVAAQMAHYVTLIAAATAAAATTTSSSASGSLTRISPFHAPPTPLSATATASASVVHPFTDAPRPSQQQQQPPLLLSPRPSASPARHTTPGPSFASGGSGPLVMPRPTSHGPSRLLLSPRPATAGNTASAAGAQAAARSPRPHSFLFGATQTGAA